MKKRTITEDELVDLLFADHQVKWNEVYKWIDVPLKWEKLYLNNGTLIYEGFTVNHKAYGAGTSFYPDGKPKQEGIWGIKGLLVGREYYSNGQMRFEGVYRLNQAYGPNEPVFGTYYSSEGELKYYGKFQIFHGSVGYPMVGFPKGFGSIQRAALPEKNLFLWDDARKLIHRKSKTAEGPVEEEKNESQRISFIDTTD